MIIRWQLHRCDACIFSLISMLSRWTQASVGRTWSIDFQFDVILALALGSDILLSRDDWRWQKQLTQCGHFVNISIYQRKRRSIKSIYLIQIWCEIVYLHPFCLRSIPSPNSNFIRSMHSIRLTFVDSTHYSFINSLLWSTESPIIPKTMKIEKPNTIDSWFSVVEYRQVAWLWYRLTSFTVQFINKNNVFYSYFRVWAHASNVGTG